MTADNHALVQEGREAAQTIQDLKDQIAGLEEQIEFLRRKYRRATETIRRMEAGEL